MELTRNTPLSIIILQDWARLFAQAEKSKLQARIQKDDFIEIQWEIVSTVKGNIRTIRDATDIEYYEFHILDKLPPSIMEKMHSIIWKLYDNKVTNVSLIWLINKQKSIQDEEEYRKWLLTPQEKENRRKQVERMNQIMVEKWFITEWDASRIIGNILIGT